MKPCFYLFILCCTIACKAGAQTVNVATVTQLQAALTNAVAGQTIIIADGLYNSPSGNFTVPAGVNGTAASPITLVGSRNAVLTTDDTAHGYGLWLKGSKYWVLKGFTTRRCKNGVIVDSSQYITVDSVQALRSGQSGICLRKWSSYCTVNNCYIDSMGLLIPGEGEGIYVGSANGNWSVNTQGQPDTCNYNTITNNHFGDHISAENIDIKEGTTGGLVSGNVFNGKGLSNENGADSWIDVKGNNWIIEHNSGTNSYKDGYQTHITYAGWGNYNTFRNNTLTVNAPGYGIWVQTSGSLGTATGNVVCNNNMATGATSGLTNVTTVTCTLSGSTTTTIQQQEASFSAIVIQQKLVIYSNTGLQVQVVVYNNSGQRIMEKLLTTDLNTIDLSGYATGTYYLHVSVKDNAQYKVYKIPVY